jgi:hypothetical protein
MGKKYDAGVVFFFFFSGCERGQFALGGCLQFSPAGYRTLSLSELFVDFYVVGW